MPIKLIQVQRKLNVGINTVVEFLRKKGFEVEDNNPNTRIGDEQYALLVKEFGKDLPNGGRERERVVPERSHREASSVKEEKSSDCLLYTSYLQKEIKQAGQYSEIFQ